MAFVRDYPADAPELAAVEAMRGLLLLEFGTGWCGHCQAAQPGIEAALASRGDIAHLKVEDGTGRPLGRAFGVKLWPTLVLLRDGREIARVVRPRSADDVAHMLADTGTASG